MSLKFHNPLETALPGVDFSRLKSSMATILLSPRRVGQPRGTWESAFLGLTSMSVSFGNF